jgi:hypothetical protein
VGTKTYGITNPAFRSAMVGLTIAYAFLLVVIFLRTDSDTWAIYIIPTLPLLPLAFVLHRASLGWIRIREEEIEVLPSWFSRRLWGEQNKNARFDSESELLLCRRFAYGAFDGFYILLRPHSGPDYTLWNTAGTATGVSRRWWSRIAQEISKTHRLRTRLVKQNANSQGMVETAWNAGGGKRFWQSLWMIIATALSPWLGVGARLLTADPSKLALIGVSIWIGAGAWIWYWFHSRGGKSSQDLAVAILLFTLQFGTFYMLAVLVTGAVLHH